MQCAVHNHATIRVADRTDLSVRATAYEVNLDRIRKVCAVVGATLIPSAALMKTPRSLQKFSTGIGLLVPALGFSGLGILSFIATYQDSAVYGLSIPDIYSLVGSVISVVAGIISFLGAFLYWSAQSRLMR